MTRAGARAALRRLARTISNDTTPPETKLRVGTIQTVTAGAATDGNAAVTVKVDGTTVPAPYNLNYTPTVGHVVLVALIKGSPVIVCRVGGFPSF
jgi:hypothetical protein